MQDERSNYRLLSTLEHGNGNDNDNNNGEIWDNLPTTATSTLVVGNDSLRRKDTVDTEVSLITGTPSFDSIDDVNNDQDWLNTTRLGPKHDDDDDDDNNNNNVWLLPPEGATSFSLVLGPDEYGECLLPPFPDDIVSDNDDDNDDMMMLNNTESEYIRTTIATSISPEVSPKGIDEFDEFAPGREAFDWAVENKKKNTSIATPKAVARHGSHHRSNNKGVVATRQPTTNWVAWFKRLVLTSLKTTSTKLLHDADSALYQTKHETVNRGTKRALSAFSTAAKGWFQQSFGRRRRRRPVPPPNQKAVPKLYSPSLGSFREAAFKKFR